MHNIYQISYINSRCSKRFGKLCIGKGEKESKIKENLFQQLIKIQRQWCYRAPIKKLSVHWQWRLFQPLLTTLLVPVCESQPTASRSVFLWMEQVQLTSLKPKTGKSSYSSSLKVLKQDTKSCLSQEKVCSLSSGVCHRNTRRFVWWNVKNDKTDGCWGLMIKNN